MLTKNQEKLIQSLQTKKGRQESGLCLIEGQKFINDSKKFIEFTFSKKDTINFKKLVTTTTPQNIAGVAKIPQFTLNQVIKKSLTIVLDNVQDPGNIGTILRLCLAFDAGLILIDSADPANPKVIRSSAGAFFQVPWIKINKNKVDEIFTKISKPIYRLEKNNLAKNLQTTKLNKDCLIIAGSEGQGITLDQKGQSIFIDHNKKLESLNVATALAITMNHFYNL